MERAYAQWDIGSYLDKLASGDPEPGGGSAAALVGATAAALVSMVTELTLGKEKFASVQELMADVKSKSEALRRDLTALVSQDAEAYAEVAAAMKTPKDTEEQKAERGRRLQAALKGAAEVPLRVAEACVAVARLCVPAAESGNPNAVSDAGVAVALAEAAAQSAALNVKINLAWIEDQAYNRSVWAKVEAWLVETARLREEVLALTYSKL